MWRRGGEMAEQGMPVSQQQLQVVPLRTSRRSTTTDLPSAVGGGHLPSLWRPCTPRQNNRPTSGWLFFAESVSQCLLHE